MKIDNWKQSYLATAAGWLCFFCDNFDFDDNFDLDFDDNFDLNLKTDNLNFDLNLEIT